MLTARPPPADSTTRGGYWINQCLSQQSYRQQYGVIDSMAACQLAFSPATVKLSVPYITDQYQRHVGSATVDLNDYLDSDALISHI